MLLDTEKKYTETYKMKIKNYCLFFLLICNILFADSFDNLIKQGDVYYNKRNEITETTKAIENIEKAIVFYEKALKQNENDVIFYKLTKAIEFKYSFLATDEKFRQEKWDALKSLIDRINKYCEKNNCDKSKYIVYSRAISTGRFGELLNIMEAVSEGIAGKIKEYAEKLLQIDDSFENHAAYIILGRMHYKAPNVIFLLTWPDKKKSKEYLEKYLQKEPESLTGVYFLADTLYDLGEKEKAKELYEKVLNAKPRKNFYYEDLNAQKEVKDKMVK